VPGSTLRLGVALALLVLAAACAPKRFAAPTGGGTPDPALAEAFRTATAACADVRTLTADIGLSGRVDGQRVRGTLQVGLTRDGGVRVEAVAPFGAPIFTIPGRGDEGTLWLPRSKEVVRGAPSAILEGLTGVSLPQAGLFELVTACPAPDDAVARAERFASPDLARVTLQGGSEIWWRPDTGAAQPIAVRREGAVAEYLAFANGRPQKLRLGTPAGAGASRADLTLAIKAVDTNVALGPEAFSVDVPGDAKVLALSEIRQAGVLR
jgi:hypothetical protein